VDDRQSTGLLTGMDAVAESFDAPPNEGSGSVLPIDRLLSGAGSGSGFGSEGKQTLVYV
jgi:hypothetical protein